MKFVVEETIMKNKDQIRQGITEKIVNSISVGTMPWRKPWSCGASVGFPSNFATPNKHYNGINPMLLMLAGFDSRYWGTLNAWKNQRGFYIPATEEPTNVVYYTFVDKKFGGNVVFKNGKAEKVPILRLFLCSTPNKYELWMRHGWRESLVLSWKPWLGL
jgi:antirestriction protein ArdC